jgi:hypothetical protein
MNKIINIKSPRDFNQTVKSTKVINLDFEPSTNDIINIIENETGIISSYRILESKLVNTLNNIFLVNVYELETETLVVDNININKSSNLINELTIELQKYDKKIAITEKETEFSFYNKYICLDNRISKIHPFNGFKFNIPGISIPDKNYVYKEQDRLNDNAKLFLQNKITIEDINIDLTFFLFEALFSTPKGADLLNEISKELNIVSFLSELFNLIPEYSEKYIKSKINTYKDIKEGQNVLKELLKFFIAKEELGLGSTKFTSNNSTFSTNKNISELESFNLFNSSKEYLLKLYNIESYYFNEEELEVFPLDNHKHDVILFWMRILYIMMKRTFNKPHYKIISKILNVNFDDLLELKYQNDLKNYGPKGKKKTENGTIIFEKITKIKYSNDDIRNNTRKINI